MDYGLRSTVVSLLKRGLPPICVLSAGYFAWESRDEILEIQLDSNLIVTVLVSICSLLFSLFGASSICGCAPLKSFYIFSTTQLGNYIPSGLIGQVSRVSLIQDQMKAEGSATDLSTPRTSLAILSVLLASGASLFLMFVLITMFKLESKYVFIFVCFVSPRLGQFFYITASAVLSPLINKARPSLNPTLRRLPLRCFRHTTLALLLLGVSFSVFIGAGIDLRVSLGYCSAWFAGFLAFFSPNGLGVREWVVGQLDIASEGVVVAHRILILASEVVLWVVAAALSRTKKVWGLRPA